MKMNEIVMMKCGHSSHAINDKGKPCCVICHGDPRSEIIDKAPDLTGRLAKCGCGNTRESSVAGLPFFEYKGPGSHAAQNMCKLCDYALRAHWPLWEYQILMVRDWFKHKKMKEDETKKEHMPSKDAIEYYVEKRIEEMLGRLGLKDDKGEIATKIYEAKIGYIKGPLPSGRGHDFVPHGPYKYDVFYCGCRGWD